MGRTYSVESYHPAGEIGRGGQDFRPVFLAPRRAEAPRQARPTMRASRQSAGGGARPALASARCSTAEACTSGTLREVDISATSM